MECQFHACTRPRDTSRFCKGWGFCKKHQDEYEHLMHYADMFDMAKVDDFWKRAGGE